MSKRYAVHSCSNLGSLPNNSGSDLVKWIVDLTQRGVRNGVTLSAQVSEHKEPTMRREVLKLPGRC